MKKKIDKMLCLFGDSGVIGFSVMIIYYGLKMVNFGIKQFENDINK